MIILVLLIFYDKFDFNFVIDDFFILDRQLVNYYNGNSDIKFFMFYFIKLP